ncbi:Mitochondrial sodium/hydrogen exchanger NHA2 [Zootermopsis nevadensis]|uniref:Mitochondrial sodium/hydrogen exchanger NHA2 n=1 Tax=Zootermopsis nevadensis TaxID=136037 RepID=A0A067RJH0_ZOONE|nr:Mitochondrial sodium/hydrogen exchanger NHA2 [Zootermopsis nevadensis]
MNIDEVAHDNAAETATEQTNPLLNQRSDENELLKIVEMTVMQSGKTDNAALNGQGEPTDSKHRYSVLKRTGKRLAPANLCPQMNLPLRVVTLLLILLLLWGVTFTLFQDAVLPQGKVFALATLFVLAYLAGWLISLIHLPPLLGMLVMGILLRNIGFFHMTGPYATAVSTLRLVAMVVILIKAGLGLDAAALKRLSFVVVKLAFIPCLVEAATVAVVAHLVLGFPWLWGILLGFVLGAVSPAVVVPSLLALQGKGYGEDKGIATLVIAASSIDDIVAISGFGVVVGLIFSTGDLMQQLVHGPIEVVIGLSFGIGWGILLMFIPHKDDVWVVRERAFLIGGGGLFAVLGSSLVGYSGAGPLACIVAAFLACSGWKMLGWSSSFNPVADIYSVIWKVFEPVLFGLIGTEIDLSQLEANTILYGLCVLAVGLMLRLLASCLATMGGTLNLKEMLFVTIAWFPKATVQIRSR